MSDVDPLSGAYCKEHDIYLCSDCEHKRIEDEKWNLRRDIAIMQAARELEKFGWTPDKLKAALDRKE